MKKKRIKLLHFQFIFVKKTLYIIIINNKFNFNCFNISVFLLAFKKYINVSLIALGFNVSLIA
jgi:hypothetical protein